jgi:prevent-host-death family protein
MPEIIPVTDLRNDAAAVLRKVRSSDHPIVITQRGRAAALLVSIAAYEHWSRERELMTLLVLGERAGRGHTLASILKEEDSLLDDPRD